MPNNNSTTHPFPGLHPFQMLLDCMEDEQLVMEEVRQTIVRLSLRAAQVPDEDGDLPSLMVRADFLIRSLDFYIKHSPTVLA